MNHRRRICVASALSLHDGSPALPRVSGVRPDTSRHSLTPRIAPSVAPATTERLCRATPTSGQRSSAARTGSGTPAG